jgi:hypothetical protein
MDALDGRFMTKTPTKIPDMIYNQSVNQANMPNFIPVQPPLRDIGPLALCGVYAWRVVMHERTNGPHVMYSSVVSLM